MKNSFETLLQSAGIEVKHWWLLLASGVVCIVLGLLALYYQADSYVILSLLFGIAIFVSGVSQTTMAIINQNVFVSRGWMIVMGILDMIIGMILMFNLTMTALALPYIFGAWLLYHGFQIVTYGGDMRLHSIPGGGWAVFVGIITELISILVLFHPLLLGESMVVLVMSLAFVFFGLTQLIFSFQVKTIHKHFKE